MSQTSDGLPLKIKTYIRANTFLKGYIVTSPTKLYSTMKLYLYLSCIDFNTVGPPIALNISETARKVSIPECSYVNGKQEESGNFIDTRMSTGLN